MWLPCQVAARKLKPHPVRPRSLHERLLEDIKAERKLRPVSPDMIRRSRLGKLLTFVHIHVLMFADMHAQVAIIQWDLRNCPDHQSQSLCFSEGVLRLLTYCMAAFNEPNPSTQKPLTHDLASFNHIHRDGSNSPLPALNQKCRSVWTRITLTAAMSPQLCGRPALLKSQLWILIIILVWTKSTFLLIEFPVCKAALPVPFYKRKRRTGGRQSFRYGVFIILQWVGMFQTS